MINNQSQVKVQEKRVFGKDITNYQMDANDKNDSVINKNVNKILEIKSKEKNHHIILNNLQGLSGNISNQQSSTDPLQQYKSEILNYIVTQQQKFKQEQSQPFGISKSMRFVLRDWLIDVHQAFSLKGQTLHLAFNYLNLYEFLCDKESDISKEQYQLVGITCLWIASKFEEILPPRMKNYVQVTANTYTLGQMKRMQEKILQKLNFNINHITIVTLFETIVGLKSNKKLTELELKSKAFAKYIMQLILIEADFMYKTHNLTKLVLSIIFVCNSVFKTKFQTKLLQNIGNYTKQQIYECYKQIVMLVKESKSSKSIALRKKYQDQKYYKVGKLKIQMKNQVEQ